MTVVTAELPKTALSGVEIGPERGPERGVRDPAVGHAHATIASMLRHQVSPTPENYQVWFSYHADFSSPVRVVLEDRLATGVAVAEAEMRALHEAFFGELRHADQIDDLSGRLGNTLRDAAGLVTGAVEDAGRYGDSLRHFTTVLERAAGRVPPIVDQLLTETRMLRERGATAVGELSNAAGRIDALRRELEEARREATTDALTGLRNRRAFDAELGRLFARPHDGGLCLLAFDLDRFKAVNDTHGHAVGDSVLRNVAAILQAVARPQDCLARLGGEEFAAILPRTTMEVAQAAAERVRQAIAAACMHTGSGRTFHVTTSVGIAAQGAADDPAGLLARADAALYAAKNGGRNQVRTAPAATKPAVAWS